MLVTLLAFAVTLGLVIGIHELGHFLAAKAVGVGVPRFSIGFGPATPLRFRRGETEYVIAWVPLGGYVKMATREEESAGVSSIEGGDAEDFPPEKLFENKPLWARIFVISAGVLMNVVLAWMIYAALAMAGTQVEDPTTRIAAVDAGAVPPEAAGLAGIPGGTQIVRINGDTVASWNDVTLAIADVSTERLVFDFAGERPAVNVPIPGTRAQDRQALLQTLQPLHEARVQRVEPGSPADRAGLQGGDLIVRVAGDTVRHWSELVARVEPRAGDSVTVRVVRDGAVVDIPLRIESTEKPDPLTGTTRTAGALGVYPQIPFRQVRFGPVGAIAEGARRAVRDVEQVVFTVRGLVLGRVSPKELGGPIVIGQLSGQMARLGPVPLLAFIAFISVNLAIFNLLPIPVLDGGHLVFLLLEGARGKPVSMRVRLWFTQAGLAILLMLVVLIVFNDLTRVLG